MALRILIVILVLAIPLELPGCGPFLPEALFHTVQKPEAPADFVAGQLGILLPSYERFYQVIAYRYLAGTGLNAAERRAVVPPPAQRDLTAPPPLEAPNPWLIARNQAPGIKPLDHLDPYRRVERPGYFDTYRNCNDDAFRTAADTLARIRGTGSPAEWIAAQDAVFANCSQGATIPPSTSDPRLGADRAYQIASAKFYSEQYDAARRDFQTIAADPSSPWHASAPYLAARCLIRAGKYAEAETALQNVAADPALARWHEPAHGLLGYVRTRLHPAERMHELALALVKPDAQATLGQDLTDYRLLFDQNRKPPTGDDLTDWILAFSGHGAGALEKWHENRSLPWLVAALEAAHRQDSALPELLAAAAEVQPDSPGYLTVNYHRTRLLPNNDARTFADAVLSGKLPTASRNQFLAERMRLATSFDDFLRYAPRRPVAEMTYQVDPVVTGQDYLDADGAQVFNNQLPLSYLKQAAGNSLLPDPIRKELQRVLALRTLLLSHAPPFDQVFALLKTPGAQPLVGSGYGRYTKEPDKIDPYRDNWWCGLQDQGSPVKAVPAEVPFLTAAEREEAAAENGRLREAGAAPSWMGKQTIAFARAHPQDPRVPEALALVVRASRFGCTDPGTGEFSKAAFDLLHSRYANTEWAKKTPYWYQ